MLSSTLPSLLASAAVVIALVATGCVAPSPGTVEPEPPGAAKPSEPVLSQIRQLTFAGQRSGEGYFDATATRMVFQSEREPANPFYQIYVLDLRSGEERRVSTGTGKTTCGWFHPNGSRVLFASTHLDPQAKAKQQREIEERESGHARRYSWDFDAAYDLFVRDLSTDELRRLAAAPGYDAEASWSPDGRWIVFASNRHAYADDAALSAQETDQLEANASAFVDLYVVDAQGRHVRRLTTAPGYDGGPFFSADGRRIVWRHFSEDGMRAEIYSMPFDAAENATGAVSPTPLTRLGAMSWAPFFHPSGDYVVFTTNLKGMKNFELYAVDARGEREPVRVTHREGFDGLPSFSRDGSQITWTSQRGGDERSQIFVANWDDAKIRERLGLPGRLGAEVAPALAVPAGSRSSIEADDLRAHVESLTSDVADGRLTGTPGERIATSYVARVLRSVGILPAGDHGSYFQEFGFTAGVSLGEDNTLALESGDAGIEWQVDRDWRPLAFSAVGDQEASGVVFAGYGIVSPAGDSVEAIDQYAGLDVEGKWVLVFRRSPSDLPKTVQRHLRRYDSLRHKAMLARDRGARGVVFASGPRSKIRHQLAELSFDASLAGTSIAALTVTDSAAETLLAGSGETLASLQERFDADIKLPGFELEGIRLRARIDLRQQRRKGRNVLGRLRLGSEPSDQAVVIGAHVDHLGRGAAGSLAESHDGSIHRGADDNASGVAALLEIAQHLAHLRDAGALEGRRDILFGAWSGEELGLLGSNHFVDSHRDADDPHASLSSQLVAYLNLDMVGRREDHLYLYGVGSSSAWRGEIERASAPLSLSVRTLEDSYLPTDATAFYLAGVPVLSAFTGVHDDYHRPTDTADKLDYAGLRETATLVSRIAASLSAAETAPEYIATERPSQVGERAGIRIYLGTIPDYAHTDVVGVRLSGVTSGGPAAEAGLRAGDVIVEVAGRAIENIYDYTFALGDLEVGEAAPIHVERDGSRLELSVVPTSRE